MVRSVLLVGVGGQGTILTSKVLAGGLIKLGYDVKVSEIHGMSQRGGSVTTQVRYGERVHSPSIGKGEADVLVAFEKAEALRWLPWLKQGGTLIVNDYEIYPLPVLTGAEQYPAGVISQLQTAVKRTIVLNAAQIAADLGSIKAQNIVLLGALIKALGLDGKDGPDWLEIVRDNVPAGLRELNTKAFTAGMNA